MRPSYAAGQLGWCIVREIAKVIAGKLRLLPLALLTVLWLLSGCAGTEIELTERSDSERLSAYLDGEIDFSSLSNTTIHYLKTNSLYELLRKNPDGLIQQLYYKFQRNNERELLEILSDINFYLGYNARNDDDGIKYYLSSAEFSYRYIFDRSLIPDAIPEFSPQKFLMGYRYNNAICFIFEYLQNKQMFKNYGFQLSDALGRRIKFARLESHLPFELEYYRNFIPCNRFLAENTFTFAHSYGIGVPLIAEIDQSKKFKDLNFLDGQCFPATLLLRFDSRSEAELKVKFELYDTNSTAQTILEGRIADLQFDGTTPFAYFLQKPPLLNNIVQVMFPEKMEEIDGLYMLTPYSGHKIPVVLTHGLLSNPRTWAQMINSLNADPRIREHYQFWLFGYSSGNPVLYSASRLRRALNSAHQRFNPDNKNFNFSNMVLIGHSMGGLLTRCVVQNNDETDLVKIAGLNADEIMAGLTPEKLKLLREMMIFKPLPFVKRVIFIAVPHRGLESAGSWFARYGTKFIHLPAELLGESIALTNVLLRRDENSDMPKDTPRVTGVDNLAPDSLVTTFFAAKPLADIPYHTIVGNQHQAGIPGGSDGFVPYSSSHLDGAESELIVESGHSVQRNPIAIEEVREILLKHLKESGLDD